MISSLHIYFENKIWRWSYTLLTVTYYYMHIWVLTEVKKYYKVSSLKGKDQILQDYIM